VPLKRVRSQWPERMVWVRRGCGYSEGACVTGAEALVSMPRVNHGCCIT
jgi:hypothetical protein